MADFITERLERSHHIQAFTCGVQSLDRYLVRHALLNQEQDRSVTYIYPDRSRTALGYYTVAMSHVSHDIVPAHEALAKGPAYCRPTLLLARLAVAQAQQGKGIGKQLLVDLMRRFIRGAVEFGASALEVDALDEKAAKFYEKLGFSRFQDNELHLYIPTHVVRAHMKE